MKEKLEAGNRQPFRTIGVFVVPFIKALKLIMLIAEYNLSEKLCKIDKKSENLFLLSALQFVQVLPIWSAMFFIWDKPITNYETHLLESSFERPRQMAEKIKSQKNFI